MRRPGGAGVIPDYQTLMRPVLEAAANGEIRIGDVVEKIADEFGLTTEERATLLLQALSLF